jgi:hypothetical protein
LAEDRAEQLVAKQLDDEDVLLVAMQRKPNASLRDLAMQCGWTPEPASLSHLASERVMKSLQKNALELGGPLIRGGA